MSNYGTLFVSLYDRDLVLVNPGVDVISAMASSGKSIINRVGDGSFSAYMKPNDSPTFYTRGLRPGYYAVSYIHDAIAGSDLRVACFIITNINLRTSADGRAVINVSGQDLLDELTGYLHFVDIGAEFSSTLVYNAGPGGTSIRLASIGSVSTTLVQSAHPGEGQLFINDNGTPNDLRIKVTDNTGMNDGDTVCIQMNSGDHTTTINGVGNNGVYDYISIEDLMPAEASGGKRVVIPEIFKEDSIIIPMDVGTHYTRIDGDPGVNAIRLLNPIPAGRTVAAGTTITIPSAQVATTDDVLDIMDLATDADWTLDLSAAGTVSHGTAGGTSHQNKGVNIIRLLTATADLSNEWFRLKRTSVTAPNKDLAWRATSDASGVTLVMPAQADVLSIYTNTAYGVIISLHRETKFDIATEIAPVGGSDSFSLGNATEGDQGPLASYSGFSQYLTRGAWVITNDAASLADYHIRRYVRFNDIVPVSDSAAAKTIAADELQAQAVAYLEAHDARQRFYRVKCVIHKEVEVGQTINLTYQDDAPHWDEDGVTLYIVEVEHGVGNEGIRFTDLLLSENSPVNRETGTSKVVNSLMSIAGSGTNVSGSGSRGAVGNGGGGVYTAGENINISAAGVISLADDVVISHSLNIPEGSQFRLWDSEYVKYLAVKMTRRDTTPYLVFNDNSSVGRNDVLSSGESGIENFLGIFD